MFEIKRTKFSQEYVLVFSHFFCCADTVTMKYSDLIILVSPEKTISDLTVYEEGDKIIVNIPMAFRNTLYRFSWNGRDYFLDASSEEGLYRANISIWRVSNQ